MSKDSKEVIGKVQSYNISPKGFFEGMLIESEGELVQVNFEPEAGAYLSFHFPEGKNITLKAILHHDHKKKRFAASGLYPCQL